MDELTKDLFLAVLYDIIVDEPDELTRSRVSALRNRLGDRFEDFDFLLYIEGTPRNATSEHIRLAGLEGLLAYVQNLEVFHDYKRS